MKRLAWTALRLKEREEKNTKYQRQTIPKIKKNKKIDGYVPTSPYKNEFELF